MIVVLHSSRAPETRVYRLNVAHISHWAGNTFPAGSVVWMAGIAEPLLVHETPAEIDRLVLSDEWAAMMLTEKARGELKRMTWPATDCDCEDCLAGQRRIEEAKRLAGAR